MHPVHSNFHLPSHKYSLTRLPSLVPFWPLVSLLEAEKEEETVAERRILSA